MLMERYKLIDHTADIGVIAFGKDLPEVFSNTAYGMFDILTDASKINSKSNFDLHVSAGNVEELLVMWLDELLYRYETERIVCNQFVIKKMDGKSLCATVSGEKVDYARHEIKTEIKNVTYHQLKVEKTNEGWRAQVIFDV